MIWMLNEQAKDFYRRALLEHDAGPGACGFELAESQKARFDLVRNVLLRDEWDRVGAEECSTYSLLDVGCGTGDLPMFLADGAIAPYEYLGLDLMPEMVARCHDRFDQWSNDAGFRWKFAPMDVRDVSGDLLHAWGVPHRYDYSTAVATFCLKDPMMPPERVLGDVQTTIRAMAERTRKALLFTVLSPWKTNVLPDELVLDPTVLFNWAKQHLSERVDLIHSYAPHDFAIVVRFEESEWRKAWNART